MSKDDTIGGLAFFLLLLVSKWTIVLTWRFFSGAHMSGKTYNDSTWWHACSPRYRARRERYTWWKRKSRMGRAAWRHAIFWPSVLLAIACAVSLTTTIFVLIVFLPGIIMLAYKRIMMLFFNPNVGKHSDGSIHQHWTLKTRYRKLLFKINKPRGMRRHPGIATRAELRGERSLAELPVDMERAVRAELAEDLTGAMPVELKLLLDPDVDYT